MSSSSNNDASIPRRDDAPEQKSVPSYRRALIMEGSSDHVATSADGAASDGVNPNVDDDSQHQIKSSDDAQNVREFEDEEEFEKEEEEGEREVNQGEGMESTTSSSNKIGKKTRSAKELFVAKAGQIVAANVLFRSRLGFIDHERLNEEEERRRQLPVNEGRGGGPSSSPTLAFGNSKISPLVATNERATAPTTAQLPEKEAKRSSLLPPLPLSSSHNNSHGHGNGNIPLSHRKRGVTHLSPTFVQQKSGGSGGGNTTTSATQPLTPAAAAPTPTAAAAAAAAAANNPSTALLPRITNAQREWRAALNQRPATCERNQRDLEVFRSEAEASRKAIAAIFNDETISRRRWEAAAAEQWELIITRHTRRAKYLTRLELEERVKKATVDKQNEKIHSLFAAAQTEERRRREEAKAAATQQRTARAAAERRRAAEGRERAMAARNEELNAREDAISAQRAAGKERRRWARIGLLSRRRDNAAKNRRLPGTSKVKGEGEESFGISNESSSNARNDFNNSDSHKKKRLPIHSFLSLPPMRKGGGGSSSAAAAYRADDSDDDDDDPYGVRAGLGGGWGMGGAGAGGGTNGSNRHNHSHQRISIATAMANLKRGTHLQRPSAPASTQSAEKNVHLSLQNKQQEHKNEPQSSAPSPSSVGAMGTQTNDDWLDTLPSDGEQYSSDGEDGDEYAKGEMAN